MKKLIPLLLIVISCSKNGEYIQKPTCYRYMQITERWDGEMIPLKPDTSFPGGELSSVLCNNDTLIAYRTFPKEGCAGGWQQIRYILIR